MGGGVWKRDLGVRYDSISIVIVIEPFRRLLYLISKFWVFDTVRKSLIIVIAIEHFGDHGIEFIFVSISITNSSIT